LIPPKSEQGGFEMFKTDALRKQHDVILDLAGRVLNGFTGDLLAVSAVDLRSLLAKLAGQVRVHLAIEDNALYPALIHHSDETIRSTAKRFIEEMGDLKAAFTAYMDRWPNSSTIDSHPRDFVLQTRQLFGALADRIDRENNELYTLVDRFQLEDVVTAPSVTIDK
jgi:hemerythrin-like domain-containing protein